MDKATGMFDKRAEGDAIRYGILDKMLGLESDLMKISGIVHVEFDIRDYAEIGQVILIPEYSIDPAKEGFAHFAARTKLVDEIVTVCSSHGLKRSGDRIEDMGSHLYIVRNCDETWPGRQHHTISGGFKNE